MAALPGNFSLSLHECNCVLPTWYRHLCKQINMAAADKLF